MPCDISAMLNSAACMCMWLLPSCACVLFLPSYWLQVRSHNASLTSPPDKLLINDA